MASNSPSKKLHLNLFMLSTGHHEASWRHPGTNPGLAADFHHYARLAKMAEDAKMDSIFLADKYRLNAMTKYRVIPQLEAFTMLSALAAVTEKIGLTGTASTTYYDPYHLARKFASLDHISGGRAAWNIVTSTGDATARNFGKDRHLGHAERYERAHEFVEAALRLWTGWSEDALVLDQTAGIYADMNMIAAANFEGKHLSVTGPLNLPRSPQTVPVLVQAGSSEDGKSFAARWAEVVFTAQPGIEEAAAFYTDLKSRLKRWGRKQDQMKILPGLIPFIGDSEAEAKEKEHELNALSASEYGLYNLSALLQTDLSDCSLDGPLPYERLPAPEQVQGQQARFRLYTELARKEKLSIRQLLIRTAGGRGHFTITGTPIQIADAMQRWLEAGAADGFNLMPPLLPAGLEDFVSKVVPELQNRGIYRAEYSGRTLRDHLGLAVEPGVQYTE
ncbi:LLM class flavin-dependent oxidoreductase [Paenibacillus sp. JCM 10914]|uniref:LLM class flavin-dependent oxidoreductase n=1 Tax=Paenibacillus sp. JCM 10914 TaxID=1236974 RepID=UPI0003CC53B6|nr:LLM class flavin-dependent oxidoreductase [Paenibacillus sp. JCM 10914]GAE06473.1 nitrilotriacetate monooxygenase component A [Paenibacillus sp. JCM 10914]